MFNSIVKTGSFFSRMSSQAAKKASMQTKQVINNTKKAVNNSKATMQRSSFFQLEPDEEIDGF